MARNEKVPVLYFPNPTSYPTIYSMHMDCRLILIGPVLTFFTWESSFLKNIEDLFNFYYPDSNN